MIDNTFTTNLSNGISACVLNSHINDHQPVILFSNDEVPTLKSKYITIRTSSDNSKEKCHLTFRNNHVLEKLNPNIDNPNHNYDILEKSLKESHNDSFPVRVVTFCGKRHNKSLWITDGIIKSINHRNKPYKKFKQFKPDSFVHIKKQTHFNRYRHNLEKIMLHAKRFHYKDLFEQFKYDIKKT